MYIYGDVQLLFELTPVILDQRHVCLLPLAYWTFMGLEWWHETVDTAKLPILVCGIPYLVTANRSKHQYWFVIIDTLFRTCVFPLGCCRSKKSIEWLHQQRHICSTYAPTAMGASILSTNIGPEWHFFGTRLRCLRKNHENSIMTLDQWSIAKKSATGRYGLGAFSVLTSV